jgi:hypothetical protein
MIAIAITPAAYEAIQAARLGMASATPRPGPDGLIRIWLDRKFVDRLGQMRGPGESCWPWNSPSQPQDDVAVAFPGAAERAGEPEPGLGPSRVALPQAVRGDASSGGIPSRIAPLMSVRKSGVSLCPWTLTAC